MRDQLRQRAVVGNDRSAIGIGTGNTNQATGRIELTVRIFG
jgi:hypothetical protein